MVLLQCIICMHLHVYMHLAILYVCLRVCEFNFEMDCRAVQRRRSLIYYTGWGSKTHNTCLIQNNIHFNYDTLVQGGILCSSSVPVFHLSFTLV